MATLKISDLSVGDWVNVKWKDDDKWPGQISEISCTGRLEARLLDDIPFNARCTIEFVEPIPITPEILEANWWQHNVDDEYMEYYADPMSSIAHTKGTFHYRLEVPGVSVVCYFVHQLQHALRLAGIDREIVMPKT